MALKSRRPVLSSTPKKVQFAGKFTGINGATPTTYKIDPDVTLARAGEGSWTLTLNRPAVIKSVLCQATDNDGNAHDLQYTVSGRVVTLTHRTATYATLSTAQQAVGVSTRLADVSTASSAYAAAPISGTVSKVFTVLGGAITVADSAITTAIRSGGGAFVAITNGSLTVAQSGSAAGDQDSATPTAANTVVAGDALRVTTDGASTDTATLDVTFVITPAAATGLAAEDVIDEISFLITAEESDVPGAGV